MAWLNLFDVYGTIPAILYINFHFICKYIGGFKSFCGFGEEWSKGIKSGIGAMMPVGAIKYAEIIILFLLDFLIALLIFIVFFLIMASLQNQFKVLFWFIDIYQKYFS